MSSHAGSLCPCLQVRQEPVLRQIEETIDNINMVRGMQAPMGVRLAAWHQVLAVLSGGEGVALTPVFASWAPPSFLLKLRLCAALAVTRGGFNMYLLSPSTLGLFGSTTTRMVASCSQGPARQQVLRCPTPLTTALMTTWTTWTTASSQTQQLGHPRPTAAADQASLPAAPAGMPPAAPAVPAASAYEWFYDMAHSLGSGCPSWALPCSNAEEAAEVADVMMKIVHAREFEYCDISGFKADAAALARLVSSAQEHLHSNLPVWRAPAMLAAGSAQAQAAAPASRASSRESQTAAPAVQQVAAPAAQPLAAPAVQQVAAAAPCASSGLR